MGLLENVVFSLRVVPHERSVFTFIFQACQQGALPNSEDYTERGQAARLGMIQTTAIQLYMGLWYQKT